MRALAFDLARTSGWATGSAGAGLEASGVFVLPQTREDVGLYLWTARREIRRIIAHWEPGLIVFCSVLLRPKKDHPLKLRKLYGLPNVVEEEVVDQQRSFGRVIECLEARESDVRAYFLGEGNVPRDRDRIKAATRHQCRTRGWNPVDDNEADAMALLDFVLAQQSRDHALGAAPLFGDKADGARFLDGPSEKGRNPEEELGNKKRGPDRRPDRRRVHKKPSDRQSAPPEPAG